MELKMFFTVAGLIISVVNVFGIGLFGAYLATRNRITKLFDKMHFLMQELHKLKGSKDAEIYPNHISETQLQIKHLLLEVMDVERLFFIKLSKSQYRMLADCCEEFLYYDEAKKYWNKCLSSHFYIKEIEAEYHCRCGQFMYSTLDVIAGNNHYEKALNLPNDNDNRRYINLCTYLKWNESMVEAMNSCYNNQLLQNKKAFVEFLTENSKKAMEICMSMSNGNLKKNGLDAIEDQKKRFGSWIDIK